MEEIETKDTSEETSKNIARDSFMMTCLVLVSRLTGFVRTWAQAFTLGATMLASCYTVANNLPNLLFEITCGGMLYTAFLPVYLSVKKKAGVKGAAGYASNMFSIILLIMTILTVAAFIFASPLVFTQSAAADSDFSFETATLFFRFFCIEVLLYPLSALLGSILNAERKFFWVQASPIFNNFVVIASFLIGFHVAQTNEFLGFMIYAIGNPLGVLVQVILQVPTMHKCGIKIKFHIDWHDPALVETLKIGLPSFMNALCAAVMASVQSSMSLIANDAGAAILYYVRVWFVLPASLFAVPISTATFTELSHLYSYREMEEFKSRTIKGARQILFLLIPFTLYLMTFSPFLMSFFASGNFSALSFETSWVALCVMATAAPFYALVSYLQNVCAALHKLKFFSLAYLAFTIISCVFCIYFADNYGIFAVAFSVTVFNLFTTIAVFIRLRYVFGHLGIGKMIWHSVKLAIVGLIGAVAGSALAFGVGYILAGDFMFYSAGQALICIVCGGILALLITYGLAMLLRIPEADLIKSLFSKIASKLKP